MLLKEAHDEKWKKLKMFVYSRIVSGFKSLRVFQVVLFE